MIVLPFPPSMNTYWRNVRGTVKISKEGRQYRLAVSHAIMVERIAKNLSALPQTGPLRVFIQATPPDKRRRDLDNLLKAPLDALTHAGVWGDDSQIESLTIYWHRDGTPPKLCVLIEPIPEP